MRRGYTLIELLLVLAILVVAAAAVAPAMRGTIRSMTLRSAADDLRAELTRSHVAAMRTGRIQVFQYEQGGGKYKFEPWVSGDEELEGPGGDANQPPPSQPGSQTERTLKEGIKFVEGDAKVENRGQKLEEEVMGSGSGGATWSRPILFYPDGSSSDAYVVVGNDHQVGIRVEVRGLTGTVRVGQLTDLRQLEQESREFLQQPR